MRQPPQRDAAPLGSGRRDGAGGEPDGQQAPRAVADGLFDDLDAVGLEQRAARGGAVTALAQAFKSVVVAAGTLYLTRVLSPGDFGLISMIVAVTGFIDLLKDYGLSTATIQRPRISHEEVSALFWINLLIGALLTLVTAALAPLLSAAYARPELLSLTLVLALSTWLGVLPVQHLAMLKRNLRFDRVAWIDVLSAVVGTGGAVVAALRGFGAWALVVRQLLRLTAQAVLSWLLCSWRPARPAATDVRELLKFGTQVSGFQVANYLERNVDNALLGRFAGAAALGFYAKAYEIMRLPLDQLNGPLGSVALPMLSRLHAHPERYRKAYRTLTRALLLVTLPVAALAIWTADWFIPTLLGSQWAPSVPMFRWLAAGLLIKPLLNTTGWVFLSQGRAAELLRWGVIGGAIAVASFCVGLPWGALGVAISYTLVELVVKAPILLWWACRTGPLRIVDLLGCLWPALPCAAVVGACYPWARSLSFAQAPGARTALAAAVALGAGLLFAWATPAGRATLRSAVRLVRSFRGGRRA